MSTDEQLADEPLDETDLQILDGLAELWTALDPVPEDLTLEIRFQLGVRTLRAEVAELQRATGTVAPASAERELLGAGAFRDDPVHTDTLTFSCDRLSSMVTVTPDGMHGGPVRIDGWVTVPECLIEVEVLTNDRTRAATRQLIRADADGRFTVDDVVRGPAQLLFHHPQGAVLTPYFDL